MRTAYFDCIAGASGDMMLGALVDAGLPAAQLETELAKLHLKDFHLHIDRVAKNAFSAVKVDVHVHDDAPERHLADIRRVVEESQLSDHVKKRAIRIFTRIIVATILAIILTIAGAARHGTLLRAGIARP